METGNSTIMSETQPGTATVAHTSRRSRSNYRAASKLKRYKMLLTGSAVLFFLVYLFTLFYIAARSAEYDRTVLEFRKQEATLQEMSRELETLRAEREIFVQGKIPELIPLEYDVAININRDNIRNIIFTIARNSRKKTYEYRIVLSNESLVVLHPKVEILVFNDVGIQIGMAEVNQSDATSDTGRTSLDPGEVRSYSAAIHLTRDDEPRYFLLESAESNTASSEKLRKHLGNVLTP